MVQEILKEMLYKWQQQVAKRRQWEVEHPNATAEDYYQYAPHITVQPNVISFSTAMDAYYRTGQADNAHALLQQLSRLHETTGDDSFLPNTVAYNTVISAYSKARNVPKAMELLEEINGAHGTCIATALPTKFSNTFDWGEG
jgi:pentatricopeptide repeat protein